MNGTVIIPQLGRVPSWARNGTYMEAMEEFKALCDGDAE